MRLSALLLALCFVVPCFGESTRILSPTQSTELTKALNEVESYLTALKQNSNEKDLLINSLKTHLTELEANLTKLESNLQEAVKNLNDSEESRLKTEAILTQVSTELQESERLLNDYRFWSDVKVYSLAVVAVVCAVGWVVW